MKTILIISICVVVVLIVIAGVFFVKYFVVGKTMNPDVIGQIKVDVSDHQVQLSGSFVLASAEAYKNYHYRIDDNNMYIKIYGTIVSAIHKSGIFDIVIDGNFSDIKTIYLEDDSSQQIIWEK
jgi:predicted small secreted protein